MSARQRSPRDKRRDRPSPIGDDALISIMRDLKRQQARRGPRRVVISGPEDVAEAATARPATQAGTSAGREDRDPRTEMRT